MRLHVSSSLARFMLSHTPIRKGSQIHRFYRLEGRDNRDNKQFNEHLCFAGFIRGWPIFVWITHTRVNNKFGSKIVLTCSTIMQTHCAVNRVCDVNSCTVFLWSSCPGGFLRLENRVRGRAPDNKLIKDHTLTLCCTNNIAGDGPDTRSCTHTRHDNWLLWSSYLRGGVFPDPVD